MEQRASCNNNWQNEEGNSVTNITDHFFISRSLSHFRLLEDDTM